MSLHSSAVRFLNRSPAEELMDHPALWEEMLLTSPPEMLEKMKFKWRGFWARPNQLPPSETEWLTWMILAGRGFGKTRTGAETIREAIETGVAKRVAFVAPTAGDARDIMVEGESGILSCCPPWNKPTYEPSKRRVVWPNGQMATMYSADEPERLRGPQHDYAWCDELASWRYADDAWNMLMFGLRLGRRPRVVVTTTPKPISLLRELLAAPTTRVTRGSTYDNARNLAPSFLTVVGNKYEGTRLGRQELYAEMLEQAEGALWTRAMLDECRLTGDIPEMKRVVVAIDPAASHTQESAETGIVVAGLGYDGRGYMLHDESGHYSPDEWARRAVRAYDDYNADRVIGEVNNGGEMVKSVLQSVRPSISYKAVHASRGKYARAEPIAALYEQKRVIHVAYSTELESQLCTWEPLGDQKSPDRLDALVWAFTELMGSIRLHKNPVAPIITGGRPRVIPGSIPRFAAPIEAQNPAKRYFQ